MSRFTASGNCVRFFIFRVYPEFHLSSVALKIAKAGNATFKRPDNATLERYTATFKRPDNALLNRLWQLSRLLAGWTVQLS